MLFSLSVQEKIRKPILGISGALQSLGLSGFFISVLSAANRFIMWKMPYLKSISPDLVVDIGANTGEFAIIARSAYPKARIVSFEPQPEAFKGLNKHLKSDKNFKSFNVGLGPKKEVLTMYTSKFSPSSSVVIKYEDSIEIKIDIEPLNNYLNIIEKNDKVLIKMDVEGFELSVLQGADTFLTKCDYLYVESRTIDPIGCSFAEIYAFLIERGWEYIGAMDSAFSKEGKLLYFDGLFRNLKKV